MWEMLYFSNNVFKAGPHWMLPDDFFLLLSSAFSTFLFACWCISCRQLFKKHWWKQKMPRMKKFLIFMILPQCFVNNLIQFIYIHITRLLKVGCCKMSNLSLYYIVFNSILIFFFSFIDIFHIFPDILFMMSAADLL